MSVRCNFSFVLRVLGSDPLFDMCLWAHFVIQNEACLQPLPPARLPAAARCVCVCVPTQMLLVRYGVQDIGMKGGAVCVCVYSLFILCLFFVLSHDSTIANSVSIAPDAVLFSLCLFGGSYLGSK